MLSRASPRMFGKVLIANRGDIACRIIRTLRRMGVRSVAVYSEADRHAMHVVAADEAHLHRPRPGGAELSGHRTDHRGGPGDRRRGHPSGLRLPDRERRLRRGLRSAGIVFIGPTPAQMRAFGLKHRARELAASAGVPLLPGSGLLDRSGAARQEARRIGFPVMLKSTAGGGGIGMQLLRHAGGTGRRLRTRSASLPRASFGDAGLFLESSSRAARHVEVQIFGDGAGQSSRSASATARCSGATRRSSRRRPRPVCRRPRARRCTMRRGGWARRCATVAPAPSSSSTTPSATAFYFLEVNTRLQVEHGVTEEVFGIDLVEWMVRQAARRVRLPALQQRADAARRTPSRRASTPRTRRTISGPSTGLLTRGALRRPACASMTWVETAARSRRSTIRCSPRSSSPATTAPPRSRALRAGAGATRAIWRASRPISRYLRDLLDAAGVPRRAR